MDTRIPYAAALDIVLKNSRSLPSESAPFDAMAGRVLAEDVTAASPEPPSAKSAMDGFALRCAETTEATAEAPVTFGFDTVVGAGHVSTAPVPPGMAVRTMTGALLPPGVDSVVKQEDTQRLEGDSAAARGRFAVTAPLRPGENVIAAGAILQQGQRLLAAGDVVSPQGVGLLAGQGQARFAVHRRPRVGLLALGDELVEPGHPLAPGQLYVSNLYALEALCARYGAEPRRLGIAADDPEGIEALLRAQLPDEAGADSACDVLLMLGGSHQGDFDFADRVLMRLGAQLLFRRTLINLGGSTLFATRDATLFFGLPGTPMAAWLAFEVLVRPAIWALSGRRRLDRPRVAARLAEAFSVRPGRTHFIPTRLAYDNGAPPVATPLVRGMPMALPASVLANGLLHWPEGERELAGGSTVAVELLGDE